MNVDLFLSLSNDGGKHVVKIPNAEFKTLSGALHTTNGVGSFKVDGVKVNCYLKDVDSPVPIRELIAKTAAINAEDPTNIVEEECTELLKEICKTRRDKGSRDALAEEAIDVINAAAMLLVNLGYSEETIEEGMRFKLERAIARFRENGEI